MFCHGALAGDRVCLLTCLKMAYMEIRREISPLGEPSDSCPRLGIYGTLGRRMKQWHVASSHDCDPLYVGESLLKASQQPARILKLSSRSKA